MSAIQNVPSQAAYNRLFDVLTDDTRLHIVRILHQRAGPVSEERLAERLAETADATGDAESDAEDDVPTVHQFRVRLRHLHLPKLDASGLVSWDEEQGTVAGATRPTIENGALDALDDVDEYDRDSLATALADERRRAVVEIVTDEEGPVDRRSLALTIAERDADEQPSEATVRQVATQLHHRHLPRLEDAGLLAYDTDAATVTYDGPEAVSTLLPLIE